MTVWEIGNPITSNVVLGLIDSGVEVSGSLLLTMKDEELVPQIEALAAETGLVLIRKEDTTLDKDHVTVDYDVRLDYGSTGPDALTDRTPEPEEMRRWVERGMNEDGFHGIPVEVIRS